ncbi:bifunctional folylpolyglutamate synthase/dihydrofolate synthase [Apibacter sp. B3889]|uniref:bifunctional folylpolyglutamate synthase/dihydrofolate synthase n=1 Tax=unclassified Apibacter TaxID=2630820 RepID=UPI00132693C3|nr:MULTISPECIES: folylpolyglutamate synthase/dihydrofolate synthase family protein [unclassified Apibacter]MXO34505.1 bifunctional folylpolyglutamate synthase/dihydrofolate synthase [Apibacter sp. B3883]MXO41364.1 bifunctional folylpolyglutamate synthase/dihydrofolate synthase [Apibacter sp. B3889]MXP02934.1 bifunctional folylpolyglutamate synthase/dihydrofolate synthase [Apibacter sp. B3887]MXP07803.1 bifunctional folylpolyglutamate synthase/dihydrofolate synthase [Apibacter sp. B3935]
MQTYEEILEWLYTQVSNYQNVGNSAYKPGFENIMKMSEILGNPHRKFKSIHIAGTNGKGSVSNMTASILKEAGYKVGLFTSPHLKNFTERIRVDGKECPAEFVYNFLINIRDHFTKHFNPSFFELTTAMAFSYFAKEKVDIAVIEVGLGGRLDSTNIITPEVCAITSISMDHVDLLGDTLEKIATEKAGIIKPGIPVVIGEDKEEVKKLLIHIAQERNAEYIDATKNKVNYPSDLKGIYQEKNKKTVVSIIDVLNDKGFTISVDQVKKGLLHVKDSMKFRGRWEILQSENPVIICDTAHNEDGFKQLTEQFKRITYKKLRIVIGFVKGKDLDKIFPLLPIDALYYFVKPAIQRGLHPNEYTEKIDLYFKNYQKFDSVAEGFDAAKTQSDKEDLIFIGGSNFVVAEIF